MTHIKIKIKGNHKNWIEEFYQSLWQILLRSIHVIDDQFNTGQFTHTRRSDGDPESDGTLKKVDRDKLRHYRQIYLNRLDPIVFMSVSVDTSVRVYDDFNRLLFLHDHRETSVLTNELPEESDQFRFLRGTCLNNLKGSVVGHEDFYTTWSVVVVFYSFTVSYPWKDRRLTR